MVIVASAVILLVIFIIVGINIFFLRMKYNSDIVEGSKIHFKESLDLTSLLLATFESNGNKFTLMLDTGSNCNLIDRGFLENSSIEYREVRGLNPVSTTSMTGNKILSDQCILRMTYNINNYTSSFLISDLSKLREQIKKEKGIDIHGIVGTRFLKDCNYVIDFKDYIAYQRKK